MVNNSNYQTTQTAALLTGQVDAHLVDWAPGIKLHPDVIAPLRALQDSARQAGFDLQVCSGFRSFDRQLTIWNEKLAGQRPVFNAEGRRLQLETLTPWEQVQVVLRYSALPGASRHHWGSDLDIYDAAALPDGYRLQLTEVEVEPGGIMAPLHDWLDKKLQDSDDFFRPYVKDNGGIAPERWHLSYKPVANLFSERINVRLLSEVILGANMQQRDTVLAHLEEIFARFIRLPGEERR